MDSPGSPLSEHSDDEFPEEYHNRYLARDMSHASPSPTTGEATSRPAKRQRIGPSKRDTFDHHAANFEGLPAPVPDADLSSDTDGSVPGSPHLGATTANIPLDEDEIGHKGEQVSHCRWEGCTAGDLGNMDILVQHLHDEHIHARQKKYACEWAGCSRKGVSHASGYALRAHMRSHTREKPFYCTLPECDRSFTRSDALAKHMRTVHETEALRPSDPVPKHHSSNPINKAQKIRLTFKALSSSATGAGSAGGANGGPGSEGNKSSASIPASPHPPQTDEEYEQNNVVFLPVPPLDGGAAANGETFITKQFPPDIQFSAEELALPPQKLYALLRHQLKWCSADHEMLSASLAELEMRREREWKLKELCFENELEAELLVLTTGGGRWQKKRKTRRRGRRRSGDESMEEVEEAEQEEEGAKAEDRALVQRMAGDMAGASRMPLTGGEERRPWWRKMMADRRKHNDGDGIAEDERDGVLLTV